MAECTHGMPTPGSCLTCMEDGNLPAAPRPLPDRIFSTFSARYDGTCAGCDEPITVGDNVHRLEPSGRYVHAFRGCEDDA